MEKITNFDMEDSEFSNVDDTGVEDDDDDNFMGDDWEWDQWTTIGDNGSAPGPPMNCD